MKTHFAALLLCLTILILAGKILAADNPNWPQKWNYIHVAFESDQDVDHLIDLLKQSKDAGCTHIALGVTGYGRVDLLTDPKYIAKAQKIRAVADELKLELVPMIYSIGYGGETLRHDGNLMAGMPVQNEEFVIKGTTGEPDGVGLSTIKNGGFEDWADGKPTGWDTGNFAVTVDNDVKHGGNSSLKMTPRVAAAGAAGAGGGRRGGGGGGASISQKISVKPFQYYKLSAWVKSEGGSVSPGMLSVNAKRGSLTRWEVPPSPEQKNAKDWVQVYVYFNTLDSDEITVSIAARTGRGGGGSGFAGGGAAAPAGPTYIDDVALEPGGLMLALHRNTVPLVVTSEDGKTTYAEWTDYFPVIDSAIADFPNVGELDITHAPPKLMLTKHSAIKDGQKVLVSFYNTTRIGPDQDVVTMQDPIIFKYWDEATKELVKVWPAKGYFITAYDEIRIAGWEPNPNGEKLTPGQLLSRHTIAAYNIVKKYAPDATVYTWSDMYTPFHNARPGTYYLCNGNFENAIEGIPTDMGIMNWNLGRNGNESILFFADKGFHQVFCGYYDAKNAGAVQQGVDRWMSTAGNIKNIDGMMYTTWEHNYQFINDFFKAVDAYPN